MNVNRRGVGGASKLLNKDNLMLLPESIVVETRIINQEAAKLANIKNAQCVDKMFTPSQQSEAFPITVVPVGVPNSKSSNYLITPTNNMMNEMNTPASVPTTCNASTLTDGPNPTRNRSAQTDFYKTLTKKATIGIQCNFQEDEDDIYIDTTDVNNCDDEPLSNIKEKFLQFVTEKSTLHSNGKLECLLCGEIEARTISMAKHMAIHWGNEALCWRCGQRFCNDELLTRHACDADPLLQKRRRRATRSIMCPHYRCGVIAISQLELYDHINEHQNNRRYLCYGCKRRFHTAGELRHHLPLRLQCLEAVKRQHLIYPQLNTRVQKAYRARVFNVCSAKRKGRVIVMTFLSQRNRTNRYCRICLKYCSNKLKYKRHSQRCMNSFIHRFKVNLIGQFAK